MAIPPRILFGIITKSHTELALDEMYGLQDLGYLCDQFEYGAKKKINSKIGRFYIVLANAIKLLLKTYKFKPNFIYLNSRLEFVASTRDFITILIIKTFYPRKIHFLLKSHGSNLEVLNTKKILYSKIVFPFLKSHIRGWLFLSTEELKWIISNELIDENKLFLSKNIVRIEKFKNERGFRNDLSIPNDCKILLFVGRLIKEKGIHYIIDAFAEIKEKNKVMLIIVGDGEELQDIKEKIELLDIKREVILTGWVDEEKAAYYTSNCDLLIFPTFCSEGFPMALFNSLAAGLSIVTTPTRAAIDYLQEPENCLWVEPRSSVSIISAVSKLLTDEHLMQQMRANNKVKSHLFKKSIVAEELSSILASITSNDYNKNFIKAKN